MQILDDIKQREKSSFKTYMLFLIKSISFFAILAFALILLDYLNPNLENLSAFVDAYMSEFGLLGMFIFMLLCAVLSSFFVPRQVLSGVAGYAYGAVLGTFLATLGVTLGCFCTFMYSRFLLQRFAQSRIATRIIWMEHLFSKNPFGMAVSIRFIPVGSNVLLNMVAGITKIPVTAFCLGSLVGYIPQNLVFALLGTGLRDDPLIHTLSATGLYLFGITAGILIFKKCRPTDSTNLKAIIGMIFKPNKKEQKEAFEDLSENSSSKT